MSLSTIQKQVDDWIQDIGVRYFNELTNMTLLTEEVGELARVMSRIYGEQSFKTKELELAAKSGIQEELADILFVLVCLANQTDTDLQAAFDQSMQKKTRRDKDRHKSNPKLG